MKEKHEWIIIDNYKNIITFDPLDRELSLCEIIKKNISKAKRIKTFKELDKAIREIIKVQNETNN